MSHIVVKQNGVHVLFLTTVFSNIQARYFHHISMFFSYTWMSLTCTRLIFISETTFDAQINSCMQISLLQTASTAREGLQIVD